MKFDYSKKNPLTSVDLIPEGNEDEYLTEEQTAEFKKVAMRCVRISYCSILLSAVTCICELVNTNNLLNASGPEHILAVVGYVGLGLLIISLVFLFLEGRKLKMLSEEYCDDNIQPSESVSEDNKNDSIV